MTLLRPDQVLVGALLSLWVPNYTGCLTHSILGFPWMDPHNLLAEEKPSLVTSRMRR